MIYLLISFFFVPLQEMFLVNYENISIELPATYVALTKKDVNTKYGNSGIIPDIVYESPNSSFSITSTSIRLEDSYYENAMNSIVEQYKNIPNTVIISKRIDFIDNKKFIFFKMKIISSNGNNIIVNNLTTDIDKKMITITLSEREILDDFDFNSDRIIQSIKIRG